MSLYSLPIVILNLGGEMFYVLDLRLRAQKIPPDRAQKVINEIASMMLNQKFLEEIFKPQSLCNKKELYLLFRDIAHASIMKLDDFSMSKLYDLMVMVFKYQLYFATQPRDLLLITLNHLDSLRTLVTSSNVKKQLDVAYYFLMQTYYPMSDSRLQRIRYDVLNYFQDMHITVSFFLRLGQQNNDGTFVTPTNELIPNGIEPPGIMKVYHKDGSIKDVISFSPGGEYNLEHEKGNFGLKGKRSTLLGTSIYKEKSGPQDFSWSSADTLESQMMRNTDTNGVYSSELQTLMTQLLGEKSEEQDEISIDLFSNTLDTRIEKSNEEKIATLTLNDTTQRQNSILEAAASEINVDVQTLGSNNLLDLLENIE